MQPTSLNVYFGEVMEKLGARQKSVLEAFTKKENFTNAELADFLQWPINTVTPRVFELRAEKVLREHCVRACQVTGRKAKCWEIVINEPPKDERSYEEESRARTNPLF